MTTGAGAVAQDSAAVQDSMVNREWVADGLSPEPGMASLSATLRPIDALSAPDLSWLTPYVQPLQDVLDRLAGNASAIHTFADTWRRTAEAVNGVGGQLARSAPADTVEWTGESADRYRDRAAELTAALAGSAALSSAMATLATGMGEVVSGARKAVGDLVTDLVDRLASYVRQAKAAEGGLTPEVLAEATRMVDTYRPPIADIEAKLAQTIANLESQIGAGAPVRVAMAGSLRGATLTDAGDPTVLAAAGGSRKAGKLWELLQGIFGRRKDQQLPSQPQQGKPPTPRAKLPDPKYPADQLQAKFKHATDFGVQGNWNKETAKQFEKALWDFAGDPANVVIDGTLHTQPAKLIYNPNTAVVQVLRPDGTFWTGFKMSQQQLQNVVSRGALGGAVP